MALRIFLMVSSVSIMAMRRRGVFQREQTVSISNVFFRSWLQEICGSSLEQPGQQRIILAHCFVGNDGDLAIAWGSDEGDDITTLEEAEDALARTTHELLDLVLGGRGCW